MDIVRLLIELSEAPSYNDDDNIYMERMNFASKECDTDCETSNIREEDDDIAVNESKKRSVDDDRELLPSPKRSRIESPKEDNILL